jgi:hypothetical protein
MSQVRVLLPQLKSAKKTYIMAAKKSKRYSASFEENKRMKDFAIVIVDKRQKVDGKPIEIFRKPGYCSKKSARRGYMRLSTSFLNSANIEIAK